MPKRLLVPGRTVWRVERCPRAAVLIDASSCFGAMRSAFLAARRSIYVVGWDIDSRTELVGEAPPTDGLPTAFGPFLVALLARKPEVRVDLLLWDYSLVYAHEREKLPRLHLDWQMPPQVAFRLDNTVSVGSSQHQKLVIVDDTLAFSGGLDLTIRRWDTPGHEVEQARRVDPDGKPYKPFHTATIAGGRTLHLDRRPDRHAAVDGARRATPMMPAGRRWRPSSAEACGSRRRCSARRARPSEMPISAGCSRGGSRSTTASKPSISRVYGLAETGYGRPSVRLVAAAGRSSARCGWGSRSSSASSSARRSLFRCGAGSRPGEVRVFAGGRLIARTPLVAADSVSAVGTPGKVAWYARRTVHHLFGLVS